MSIAEQIVFSQMTAAKEKYDRFSFDLDHRITNDPDQNGCANGCKNCKYREDCTREDGYWETYLILRETYDAVHREETLARREARRQL